MEVIDRFKCSFRFLDLSEDQARRCALAFGIPAPTRRNFKGSGYCVVVELHECSIHEVILAFMKKESITSQACDVFVSILTVYDSRIYGVPKWVTSLQAHAGCELVLSFTSVGNDKEPEANQRATDNDEAAPRRV